MNTRQQNLGFTYTELLVSFAIIAILVSTSLTFLGPTKNQSYDARRVQDIGQLQAALQLYYNRNGRFPISTGCNGAPDPRPDANWCNTQQTLSAAGHWIEDSTDGDDVLSSYISNDPVDPIARAPLDSTELWSDVPVVHPAPGTYYYISHGAGAGQWYAIVTTLENAENHPLREADGVQMCDDSAELHYGNDDTRENVLTLGISCK